MQSEKRTVQPAKDLAQRNRVGINAKRLQTLSQFDRVVEFSKREEEYQVFAWIAFFCILLELLLRNSVLKKIP